MPILQAEIFQKESLFSNFYSLVFSIKHSTFCCRIVHENHTSLLYVTIFFADRHYQHIWQGGGVAFYTLRFTKYLVEAHH